MVTALMIPPGEHPCPTLLCDDGNYLNHAVSIGADTCYTAKADRVEDGVAVLYGYEADMLDGTGNRRINGCIYAGTIYIVGYRDGKLISLSDKTLARYAVMLWHPEHYTEEELLQSALFWDWKD